MNTQPEVVAEVLAIAEKIRQTSRRRNLRSGDQDVHAAAGRRS